MKTYLYKLKFLSPLHLSSDPLSLGKAEVVLHSDTLFSAIANSYSQLFEFPDSFFETPPFLISSAFPYARETLFVPKPLYPFQTKNSDSFRKKIKNSSFITMGMFEKFAKGEEIKLTEESFATGGFMSERPLGKAVYTASEKPRSTVPRAGGDTEIFYSTSIRFEENSGLYFFAEFPSEESKKQFDAALYLLGDTGIGGERTAGYGRFEFSAAEYEPVFRQDSPYFMAISLYYPSETEIKNGILQNARYAIVSRQNWIFSGRAQPIRSKKVRMFTEGSIFRNAQGVSGKMTDVTPKVAEERLPHKVIRYGKLFKLGITEKAIREAD